MIITKLKKAQLTGRGGANFLVWQKWQTVKKTRSTKKYVICNAAESEPNTFKDQFLLSNYPETVINGINIALEYLDNASAIIYLKSEYFKLYSKKLKKIIKNSPIELFEKTGNYLCGEETTLINDIEGQTKEPRMRPPFPTNTGLYNHPTIVNNVETFYYASEVADDTYNNTRFVCIAGDTKNTGTFEVPQSYTINKILKTTKNYPRFNFFVQVGGGASGEFFAQTNINKIIKNTGSIIIYDSKKTNINKLLLNIIKFFNKENCNKCLPCREGVYRANEMLKNNKEIDIKIFNNLLFTMENTSFCALGKSISTPIKSLLKIKK